MVLHTLELMLALMECVDDMQVSFCQAIQVHTGVDAAI